MDRGSKTGQRMLCPRCLRPAVRCLCRHLEGLSPLANRTGVIILQHPRERLHPLGTAPLLRLGLRRVRLEVAWDLHHELEVPPGTGLLSPGRGATPLEELPAGRRPPALLLLDGTWHQARKLLQHNPWLEGLPRHVVRPATPGRYRIRGEPDEHSLSTVEAAILALRLLEPELGPDLDRLGGAFDAMIEQQVQVIARRRGTAGRRRRRFPEPDPLHARLRRELPRLLLLYVEAAGPRVLQVAAVRPASGEEVEIMVRPGEPAPEPWLLRRMELPPDALDGALPLQEARARWRAFAGPEPLLVAWNQRSLDLVRAFDPAAPAGGLLLKAAYCNLGRGGGALGEIVRREALRALPHGARGRAGRRLGNALAVLRWLTALGR